MPSKKGAAKTENSNRAREAAARFADAARLCLKDGKFAEARKLVEDALSLVADSPRLYVFHARVLAEMQLPDEAKAAARLAFDWVNRKPDRYHEYRTYLERELLDFPQVKEAFFERSKEIERQAAEKDIELARRLKGDGDLSGAMRAFLRALASRTQDGPALAGAEKILHETQNEKGRRYFDSFRAGQLSRKDLITLLAPDEGELLRATEVRQPEELGVDSPRELTLGDLVAEIERELDADVNAAPPPEAAAPQDFAKFRKRAEATLQSDPKSRIDLAIGYFEMGLTEVAFEELRAVPASHDLFLRARCLLGEFLLRVDEPLKALPALQECLHDVRISADEANSVRYHLAKTYVRLGDWPRAMVEIEALEKRDPNYRDLRFLKTEITRELEGDAPPRKEKKR